MAMARSLLRSEAHQNASPRDVLQRVNHHLMDLNEGEMVSNHEAGIARFDDVTVVVIQNRRDGPP